MNLKRKNNRNFTKTARKKKKPSNIWHIKNCSMSVLKNFKAKNSFRAFSVWKMKFRYNDCRKYLRMQRFCCWVRSRCKRSKFCRQLWMSILNVIVRKIENLAKQIISIITSTTTFKVSWRSYQNIIQSSLDWKIIFTILKQQKRKISVKKVK